MNKHLPDKSFPKENIYEMQCPIVYALDILGQKWKIPILYYLIKNEPTRYNELKRAINDVTNMMLTKSLRELEEHNLIKRIQYETIPPKVEYSVTARGKTLFPALHQLYLWGEEQIKIAHSNLKELGATEEMLPLIANSTVILNGGYKKLTKEEILEILKLAY